mgnify:CR=1 FL=1
MTAKILHVSDSLIGEVGDSSASATDAPVGGIGSAVDRARELAVDVVVHTGNLFQQADPDQAVLDAVDDRLDDLASDGIPFFVVEGRRESYGDGTATDRLCARAVVEKLGATPTLVGDLALYGVDHADDEATLLDRLDALEPADAYAYNVVCLNQRVWPPLWEETADVSAYDVMETTDVHVNEVLAGGVDEASVWESDEFPYRVSYAGSTNPRALDGGELARGTLLDADADGASHEQVPLVTTGVDAEIAHLRRALDFDRSDLEGVETERLADLYGLAARAKSAFDDRRQELRDELLDRVETDRRVDGHYASVTRGTRRRRTPKEEGTVFETVEQAGIDRDEVVSLDASALRDLADEGRIDEAAVFDVEGSAYVRVGDVTLE